MATNARTKLINKEAKDDLIQEKTWYDEDAIANIFSLNKLAKKEGYRIQYDSAVEDTFILTRTNPKDPKKKQTFKFKGTPQGLYVYKPDIKKKSNACTLIDTVAENRNNYTVCQYERAKVARNLYHKVGAPSVDNFKRLLRLNQIKNCPVLPEDVDIASKIFGPDMSTIKGKSKRHSQSRCARILCSYPRSSL
jgi:hypothetical protein